jgi:sugar phosphate isomerase/epimerase
MRLGIFAKTFAAPGAAASLAAARQAGYEAVQFNMAVLGLPPMPDEIGESHRADIRAAALATGVAIPAISGTYNMIHPNPQVRADGMRRLGVMLRAASAMDMPMVTLCTGTRDPNDQWAHHPDNATPQAWADLLAAMGKAVDLAEAAGIDLGVEPELANVVSSAGHAARLIAELKSPRVKVVLDPANLFEIAPDAERRRIVEQAVDAVAGHIAMAHAKDRNSDGTFAAAGAGVIDFPHFVRRLRQAGFDGSLVTHGLAEAEAPRVAAFLRGVLDGASA